MHGLSFASRTLPAGGPSARCASLRMTEERHRARAISTNATIRINIATELALHCGNAQSTHARLAAHCTTAQSTEIRLGLDCTTAQPAESRLALGCDSAQSAQT